MEKHDGDEDNDGSGSENEYYEEKYDVYKNAAIVVIDVCASMFTNDLKCRFRMCLQACYLIMDEMLMKRYYSNFAICILQDDDNVVVEFNADLVESMKKLKSLLKIPVADIKQQFLRNNKVSLRDCLTGFMKMFSQLKKINPFIAIMTTDSDPHLGDVIENLGAINIASGFSEMNLTLCVLPLEGGFTYEPIYKDLLENANNIKLEGIPVETYTNPDELIDVLHILVHPRKNIKRTMLRYSNESYIVVQIEKFYKFKKLFHNTHLHRTTKNEVKQRFKDDISKEERHVQLDHSSTMKLDAEDLKIYKKPLAEPGLKLLYVFEKRSQLHCLHKKAFMVQLDELTPKRGPQILFDYFWDYCSCKNRVLMCSYYIPGSSSVSHVVELSPHRYKGKPCFIGVIMANEDEVNEFIPDEEEESPEISAKDLDSATEVIENLTVDDFDPFCLINAEYEIKASLLKSDLLDIDVPEIPAEMPTLDDVTKRVGQAGANFKKHVIVPAASTGTKRKMSKK